jgi:hypothetical protein
MEPALIAATVSLLIFAFGRWHDARVKQTQFLQTKLEDLFTSLEAINENSSIIDIEPALGNDELRKQITIRSGNLIRSMNRPSMLSRLYFPDAVPRVDCLGLCVLALHRWMIEYGSSGNADIHGGGYKEFNDVGESMINLKTYLQENQYFLTKNIGCSYAP